VGVVSGCVSRQAGGLFHSVRRLSQSIRDAGWDVSVFSLEDGDTAADISAWLPIVPQVAKVIGPHRLGYSPGFAKLLRAFSPKDALVHEHGIWQYPSYEVLRWNRRTQQPTVISPRGMLDPWAVQNSGLRKKLVGILYEYANLRAAHCIHALAVSGYEGIRKFGLKNPVAIIPNGIDVPTEDDLVTPPPPDLPSDWNGARIMLFLGRVHPKKGLLPLIEGWSRVGKVRQDWKLVIAGPDEGGHEAEVEDRVKKLGVERDVRFVGPQYGASKKQWLNYADAFVLPSFSEGFPMAVLEAMAHKLPVLMTRECNFPEAFSAEVAYEARPEPTSIGELLEEILPLSDVELTEIGRRARSFACGHYAWPIIANEMIAVYDWLLGGGSPPTMVRTD
jgi:poly(glycerol-phosphate) alpha-glucosyltransferase